MLVLIREAQIIIVSYNIMERYHTVESQQTPLTRTVVYLSFMDPNQSVKTVSGSLNGYRSFPLRCS